ncbi:hypothetical protein MP228_000063 [Amoeboaphelidium protococcarum]|nr:hypothetical protein MP228_000063 [Amoeboaphelidium protococcarum]
MQMINSIVARRLFRSNWIQESSRFQRSRRGGGWQWLNGVNPEPVIYSLIGVNLLVFLEWQRREYNAKRNGDYRGYKQMLDNFTVSGSGVLREHRYHTLLTSMFSHKDVLHLALNMVGLYSFGPSLAYSIGLKRFLLLYLGGGLASSTTSALYHYGSATNNTWPQEVRSMGASGGLMSMFTNFALLFPHAQVWVLIFPVPSRVALIGFAVYDFFFMGSGSGGGGTRIDHVGHLGGLAFGALSTALLFRGRIRW